MQLMTNLGLYASFSPAQILVGLHLSDNIPNLSLSRRVSSFYDNTHLKVTRREFVDVLMNCYHLKFHMLATMAY
jgi:hypothetical protein